MSVSELVCARLGEKVWTVLCNEFIASMGPFRDNVADIRKHQDSVAQQTRHILGDQKFVTEEVQSNQISLDQSLLDVISILGEIDTGVKTVVGDVKMRQSLHAKIREGVRQGTVSLAPVSLVPKESELTGHRNDAIRILNTDAWNAKRRKDIMAYARYLKTKGEELSERLSSEYGLLCVKAGNTR